MVHWDIRRSSAERRIEATALLQKTEILMMADQMVAFADLFGQNTVKADTYISVRPKGWEKATLIQSKISVIFYFFR